MAELKTKRTTSSVADFLEAVEHPQRKADAQVLLQLMQRATREEPKMWGPSIVGFGSYHYRYASGQEGEWPLTGFSPRKAAMSVYIMSGFDRHAELMAKLGKFKTGKGCLYITKLADVDIKVLEQLVKASVQYMKTTDHIAR